MKKSTKTNILRFAYIGVTVLVIILIGAFNTNFSELENAIGRIHPVWILGAIVCMVLYWLTDAWLLKHITDYMSDVKLNFGKSFKISIIGLYYAALTPSSVGAQPMQIVYMNREKISVGRATCIVVIKFIAYSLTVITFYVLSHWFIGDEYLRSTPAIYWLCILGLLLNIFAVSFFILTIISKTLVLKIGHGIIGFLHKIKLMRKPEKALRDFDKQIEDYTGTSQYIKEHKLRTVWAFMISFLNIGLMFAITYFIYRAFGLNEYSFLRVIAVQALLYVAIHYFPLPGGAGASEGGFFSIFSAFFAKDILFAAMLIWRIMTYYIILAVGSLIVVFDELHNMRKKPEHI